MAGKDGRSVKNLINDYAVLFIPLRAWPSAAALPIITSSRGHSGPLLGI